LFDDGARTAKLTPLRREQTCRRAATFGIGGQVNIT
jgi:hypothetical protein